MVVEQSPDELLKRHELLLAHARAAFDEQHRRYEWGEVKISRYLTVLTVIIGVASVRLPELTVRVGHLQGRLEWGFVIAYALTGAAAIVSVSFALSGLAYARVPNLAMDADLVAAINDNPLSDVVPGLADRYLEAARALRTVNASRFRRGERAYWAMAVALFSAVATTVLYVTVQARASHP